MVPFFMESNANSWNANSWNANSISCASSPLNCSDLRAGSVLMYLHLLALPALRAMQRKC